MHRSAPVVAAVLASAAFLAAQSPAPLQDSVERPEPDSATLLRVNPPTFRWPSETRVDELQLARSADFAGATKFSVKEEFYRPLRALAPGTWHWRLRKAGGEWQPAVSFSIPAELPKWDVAEWSELLARAPSRHPRILLRPEDVQRYRARAAGPMRDYVVRWGAQLSRSIGAAVEPKREDTFKPPESGDAREDKLRQQKVRTWDAKSGAHRLMDPVGDLSWLWMLTGDERFVAEARRRVLIATRMDPEKDFTDRTSDFANAKIASQSAIAYDMLYDRFSPEERAAIRKMILARLEPIFRKIDRAGRRLFSAHGWQHVYMDGLAGALAVYDEEPAARKWLENGIKSFVAFYPWYGGLDGGSAEGTNYYTCCNMLTSLVTRDLFASAFGVDFAVANPWFKANPYYLIYALPPGQMRSLFGDVNPSRAGETPGPEHRLAALRMSDVYRNGHAADYARRLPAKELQAPIEEFRWAGGEPVKPVPLETLSPARAFRDIGMAFFHSAMTEPDRNVRLEFRSSPYGSVGHSHADQNTFNIIAYNKPLIIDSGYYTAAGDRHHAGWTRQTRAHNSLLVDGTGQSRTDAAGPLYYGQLKNFEQTNDWVYVSGAAATAYREVTLSRFDRHIVWLRGKDVQTYVILDEIEPSDDRPHRYDWLLHAARQMEVDSGRQRLLIRSDVAEARVVIVQPSAVVLEQSGKFDPAPENWRPGRDYDLKDQWHFTARATASGPVRYIAVIQVAHPGAPWPEVGRVSDGVRLGKWTVALSGHRAAVRIAQ